MQVPENLSEIQRCLVQLTGGHAIQQMHAIERQSLPFLLWPALHVSCPSQCVRTINSPWICMAFITSKHDFSSLHDLAEIQATRRLPAVARLSGRDGLEQVLPDVLDSLMVLSTDAQVSSEHC